MLKYFHELQQVLPIVEVAKNQMTHVPQTSKNLSARGNPLLSDLNTEFYERFLSQAFKEIVDTNLTLNFDKTNGEYRFLFSLCIRVARQRFLRVDCGKNISICYQKMQHRRLIMSEKTLSFTIKFEGREEKPIELKAYAFDEKGELIAAANVKRNQASLEISDEQATKTRIVLAPLPPEGIQGEKPSLDQIQLLQSYMPEWRFNPRLRHYDLTIPEKLWKLWKFCKCEVKGKVVKRIKMGSVTQEWPVYMARVHICEVDPIWLILKKLPPKEILQLRDDLIKEVGRPIPQPPEPPLLFADSLIDPTPENIAKTSMELPIQLREPIPKTMTRRVAVAKKLAISATTKSALSSASAETVRSALTANVDLIRPYLCEWRWLWPFFTRCDEVAIAITDKQGKFNANLWYLCAGDHPDLYFWVEYQLGGVWTTVYHPSRICHTYWNYPCGNEVTIPVTDPRVPWYSEPPPIPGKQVAVLTIGNQVSIMEIQRAPTGDSEGLTTLGQPFGGSLEPTVWFGEGVAASGITHYRWSYRRLTKADGSAVADVWHPVDYRVIRHYGEIYSDGTLVFKPFFLGPDPDIPSFPLFKLQPKNPPMTPGVVSASWAPQLNARENTASAFFLSHLLEGGDAKEAAGKYELKLELFRYNSAAHVVTRVNLQDESIPIKIPIGAAPFGVEVTPTTVTTRTVPHDAVHAPDMEDRVIREAGKVVAFRLVLHVDNNPCEAETYPIKVSGVPPVTWETVGECGFIRYTKSPPAPTPPKALLTFKANHPNGFARFVFTVAKGSTGFVNAACSPANPSVSWTTLPLVTASPVNGYVRNPATAVFSKEILVLNPANPANSLVGTCPEGTAAFAENLSVYPLATDGWDTLWYLSRYGTPMAFALQPK